MNFQEVRQKYPQYNDLSDDQLAAGLHQKYYSDMPFNDFASAIGYEPTPQATAGRIAGRFFETIKSAPSRMAAAQRAGLQSQEPSDLANKPYAAPTPYQAQQIQREMMDAANRGETWMPKKTAVDSTFEKMSPDDRSRVNVATADLVSSGYNNDAAFQQAVMGEVERKKQDRINDLKTIERDFAMSDRYTKSSGLLEDIAGGLGTSLVSLPAYAMHPLIGAMSTYDQIAGAKVQELEAMGLTDPVQIMKSARVSAAIQTPLEAVSDLFVLSRILKPTGKWTSALVSVAQSMAGEGATEFVQQYPDEFATMMAVNPDLTDRELWNAFYNRLPETTGDAAYAGLVGALAGGLTTGVGITGMTALDKMITPKQRVINESKLDKLNLLVDKAKAGTITEDEVTALKDTLGIKTDIKVDDIVADVEQRVKLSQPIVSDSREAIKADMGKALGEDKAGPVIDLMDGVARAWARRNGTDPASFYTDVLAGFQQGAAAEMAGGKPVFQTEAWHGSPHAFDRFSTEKIGTGEGAQAFGYGLYFTDKEEIARHYAENVKPDAQAPPRRTFLGNELTPGTPEYHAATLLERSGRTLAGVKKEVKGWIKEAKPGENVDGYKKTLATLERAKTKKDFGVLKPAKNIYRATINEGKEDVWLDWDKPVSGDTLRAINKLAESKGIGELYKGNLDASGDINGEDVYRDLSSLLAKPQKDFGWERVATTINDRNANDKAASSFLKEAGIDGIRYPTESLSGKTGTGKYNYVVFDENSVKINERIQYQAAKKQTETPAFKEWFGDSKVVDDNGDPLVVYHGTTQDFSEFDTHNAAFFTDDNSMADTYSGGGKKPYKGGQTVPVYLSLKNPLSVDAQGSRWNNIEYEDDIINTDDLVDMARSKGHDGIIVKNIMDGGSSTYMFGNIYAAFEPTQIKSAIGNRGTFDPNNPDIRYQPGMDDLPENPAGATGPRGAVTNLFSDLPKVIHAFESADPSTPIHELGHILTGMMSNERTGDYFALAEFAGVDADRANGGIQAWTDDELEVVARAFEAYVMEGKSPSLRLRDIFKAMRDWLIDVYKSVKALDVKLTDNVREVFDRLVAADFEQRDDLVSEVNEWINAGKLNETAFNPETATIRDIERESIRRVTEAGAKERKKIEKSLRAEFRASAEATIAEYPYFKMLSAMRAGGLSIDKLKAAFDNKTVKKMMAKLPGVIKAGGQDPYSFAASHGYQDVESLVNDIIAAPTKAAAVKEHFDALWAEYQQTVGADNAELYAKALEEQERIILELAGKQPTPKKPKTLIRESTGQVSDEEYKKLVDQFRRDAKIARESFIAGKREEAAKLIAKQAERMAKIKDAKKTREARAKINRRMQRIIRLKGLPPEYKAQVNHFLAEYYSMPAAFTIKPEENLDAFLERKYEANSWVVDSLRAELTRKPIQDRNEKNGYRIPLDDNQLEVVANIADMLAHMGMTEGKLIKEQKKADLLNTVTDMAKPMMETFGQPGEDFGRPSPPSARRLGWWQKMSDSAKRYLAELRKAEFIFHAADGFEKFGPNWSNLFHPLKFAEDAEFNLGGKIMTEIKAAFDRGKFDRKWSMQKYQIEGFTDRLTKEEMIMIALNSGNTGNLTALREGFGWTDEMIKAVWDELSTQEVDLVNEIWDTVDQLYPHLDAVHRQLTGVSLPKVEGRYFPLVFDKDLSWQAGAFSDKARTQDLFATAYTRPTVGAGHRKTRVGGKMPPHLSFSVISKHIVSAVHDATHQVAVRNAQQIIAHPLYRGAVTASMGDATYRQLMPWLSDIARPRREPATQVDKWVGRLRRNSTIVGLGLKFSVATKQFLSWTQTVDEVGIGQALSGLAEFYAQPNRMAEFIRESSAMMRNRKANWDRELNQFASEFDPGASPGMDRAKDFFFAMIGVMDVSATYPTWLAGYRQGLKRFDGDHQQAVEFADGVVRRTQPVASPKDMSTMQRGGETRSELRKLFTMFYTFFSVFQNRLQETRQKHRLGKINAVQAAISYWWILVLPALASEWISKRKWPWEVGPLEYAKGIAGYWAAAFPFLRDLATPALSGFDYTMTPVESAMESIAELPKVVFTDKPKPRRIAKQAIKATGYLVGLPSSQINVTMDGIIDLMEDKTNNPWRLIYSEQRDKQKKELY
jgi:hypothetical protein